MNFTKLLTSYKEKQLGGVEPSNHCYGERLKHQVYNILKNLQCKKVTKSPMSKMLKKVDEKTTKKPTK